MLLGTVPPGYEVVRSARLRLKGEPVPKPSVRVVRKGKRTMRFFGSTKTQQQRYESWKVTTAAQADAQLREQCWVMPRTRGRADVGETVPLQVICNVILPRPAYAFQRRGSASGPLKFPVCRYLVDARPDIDNYYKALYDILTGIAWEDDGMVAAPVGFKWAAAITDLTTRQTEQPGYDLTIRELRWAGTTAQD